MKTLHKVFVMAALALPLVVRAGIVGSPHDFSGASWNDGNLPQFGSQNVGDPHTVCGVCHTPHNANPAMGPLWNRQTPTEIFQMYNNQNSPGANIQFTPATTPNPSSLACLSCHDGTVAINAYGGSAWNTVHGGTPYYITNSAAIAPGGNLTHSHPISFTYDSSLISLDKYLNNPVTATVLVPDNQPAGSDFSGSLTIESFLLHNTGKVECDSCHDVHNQVGTPYDIVNNPGLVKINGTQSGVGSLLCRSCHIK